MVRILIYMQSTKTCTNAVLVCVQYHVIDSEITIYSFKITSLPLTKCLGVGNATPSIQW